MKAVGARSRFIMGNYFGVVLVLGLFGTVAGLGASFLLERILPGLFQGFLPATMEMTISAVAVFEGLMLGVVVVVLFTFLPIMQLKEVRPRVIFAKQEPPAQRGLALFSAAAAIGFFFALVLWRVREIKTGMYFVLGLGLLIFLSFIAAWAALHILRKRRVNNLAVRQALRGLFRPRNATLAVIVTLSLRSCRDIFDYPGGKEPGRDICPFLSSGLSESLLPRYSDRVNGKSLRTLSESKQSFILLSEALF